MPLDERIEVEAVEQLHHVKETAVARDAEVPELHGVRRAQLRRDLRFALEAPHRQLAVGPRRRLTAAAA